MRKYLVVATVIGMSLSSGALFAKSGVALLVPVAYEDGAHANPSVKEDCDIASMVQNDVFNVMKRTKVGDETTSSPDGGRVLKIVVGRVVGISGGIWTGPKAITLRMQLLEDGKVVRATSMSSESMHFNPFVGTCSIIRHASTKLAKYVTKWANDGTVDAPASEVQPARTSEEPASAVGQ